MINHTPEPWKVVTRLSGSENHRGYGIWTSTQGFYLAEVIPVDTNGIEGWANANLIAAAPELLEALKEIIKLYGRSRLPARVDAIAKGKAAIAKAKGRE